ncbi:hypothetical protein [Aneurinibacillus tyrosinisolvens]|uniref:hypothetical protein n=1 Tax=Aneurinibacillus tyrosinisolvens TaxID=1443435 RepID=UPI00063F7AA6|nr:hypothetical protein [Aneurinibacillus tyrosinisolvens]
MKSSYIYTQTNEASLSEYKKEIRETDEELVISFQFNQTIDTDNLDSHVLSTIKNEGIVESVNKI